MTRTDAVRSWLAEHQREVIRFGLLAIVNLAPFVISFTSLTEWAHEDLGRSLWIAWALPVAIDAGMVLALVLRWDSAALGDSATGATLLFYALMCASAAGNYRHGLSVSVDAALVLGAMPIVGGFVGEVVLRHERRDVLREMGAVPDPLARFRPARWLVAPVETFGAWRISVTEGVTDAREAVARHRDVDAMPLAARSVFEPFDPPAELVQGAPDADQRPRRRRRPAPPRPGVNVRDLARDAWARAGAGASQSEVVALVHRTHGEGLNDATVRGAVNATRPEGGAIA